MQKFKPVILIPVFNLESPREIFSKFPLLKPTQVQFTQCLWGWFLSKDICNISQDDSKVWEPLVYQKQMTTWGRNKLLGYKNAGLFCKATSPNKKQSIFPKRANNYSL